MPNKAKPRSAFLNYVGASVADGAPDDVPAVDDVIDDVIQTDSAPAAPRPSKAQKPMTVRTYADVQDQFDKTVDELKRAKGQVIGALMNLLNRGMISADDIKAEIRAMHYEREE